MAIKEQLAEEWQNVQQLRYLQIEFDPARCVGTWQCYEVCPVGLWTPDYKTRVAVIDNTLPCIACGACVLQCPEDAIRLVTR
jgi:NAD-dependent dihydropyrimidine dehydrogenase PreA subunit